MEVPYTEGAEIIEGEYFAKERVLDNDLHSIFMDFMVQRYAIEGINPLLGAVRSDMNNIAACYRKMELFHELRSDSRIDVCRFVITEIECTFYVCRSLFDILQRIAKVIWRGTNSGSDLKDSFADMALRGEEIRSTEEISQRYGLPTQWSEFYVQEAPFFRKVKKYRDDIVHRSMTPFRRELSGDKVLYIDMLYSTDKGFAVKPDYKPFSSFGVWKAETFQPILLEGTEVASIRPIVAFIIKETLGAILTPEN